MRVRISLRVRVRVRVKLRLTTSEVETPSGWLLGGQQNGWRKVGE